MYNYDLVMAAIKGEFTINSCFIVVFCLFVCFFVFFYLFLDLDVHVINVHSEYFMPLKLYLFIYILSI